ncbi:hypothetical protein [Photobacterium satsumensis]|uniref:hypothetical protein n=1 Tax=Photobacterium satsumensis TaxID=2910239 RepID=UPI003D11A8EC
MNPTKAAILIIYNYKDYVLQQRKKDKVISGTRFRMSTKNLRNVVKKERLSQNYLESLSGEMMEMGWLMASDGGDYWLFVKLDYTSKWSRVTMQTRADSDWPHAAHRDNVLNGGTINFEELDGFVDESFLANVQL